MTERGILRHALDITTSKEKRPHFKHETFSSLPYATDLYSKSLALYVRNH